MFLGVESWPTFITVGLSVLSFLGFGVVIKYYWEDRRNKKIQNSEEVKIRVTLKNQAETREVFKEEMKPLIKTVDQIKCLSTITAKGTVTLLRDRMKASLNACKKQGWSSSADKANWFELYETYKLMGGNHFKEYIEQWKHDVEHLPSEEEFKKSLK